MPGQLDLLGPSPAVPELVPVLGARRLAAALPPTVRMGTSSWSFPGWKGMVWRGEHAEQVLSREGLNAYGEHPLLRAVGVDRTFYAPVTDDVLADYARRVPDDFRFLVKASEALTWKRFPAHARYGARAERDNPDFLSVGYARDLVVQPFVEGLGPKGGVLLFQFSPQSAKSLGTVEGFAERLHRFLVDLPALPDGQAYGVEVRTPALLGEHLSEALLAAGAYPCLNVIRGMPDIDEQAARLDLFRFDRLFIRWMLTRGLSYEQARTSFAPFDKMAAPDVVNRDRVAGLVEAYARQGQAALVIVNNKAEGSAPLSIFKLAERLLAQ
jgi:uncharacterized protein YecE (DUF72 family)